MWHWDFSEVMLNVLPLLCTKMKMLDLCLEQLHHQKLNLFRMPLIRMPQASPCISFWISQNALKVAQCLKERASCNCRRKIEKSQWRLKQIIFTCHMFHQFLLFLSEHKSSLKRKLDYVHHLGGSVPGEWIKAKGFSKFRLQDKSICSWKLTKSMEWLSRNSKADSISPRFLFASTRSFWKKKKHNERQ